MQPKRFNVRVYGICIHDGKVLVNEELIRGKLVTKFPGGGLDWGEGTIECLVREWKEELGVDIKVLDHYYTTDFFQASAYDDSQVISIYYLVDAVDIPKEIVNLVEQERTFWMSIEDITDESFTLPIDRRVGQMLSLQYNNRAI
jgi:ADP-ribose pyrophosphatase YjhB (NUDIX family)